MILILYILFALAIMGAWLITGYYEWQPAPSIMKRINQIRKLGQEKGQSPKGKPAQQGQAAQPTLMLCIEPWKHAVDDWEREIYMVRKSRKACAEEAVIQISLPPAEAMDRQQIEKMKSRLENRFPGVTVYFHRTGEENAVLYFEG